MAKEFARRFYSSKTWQDCRDAYAKKAHHLCENCLRKGIYKPGVIVHHIEELTPFNIEKPEVALNFDNLELLCRDCHAEIHDAKGRWDAVNAARRARRDEKNRYKVGPNGEITAR